MKYQNWGEGLTSSRPTIAPRIRGSAIGDLLPGRSTRGLHGLVLEGEVPYHGNQDRNARLLAVL